MEPGKAVVRTLEICELGFSMLGKKGLPKKVFSAMLRACMEDEIEVPDLEEDLPSVPQLSSGEVWVNKDTSEMRRVS